MSREDDAGVWYLLQRVRTLGMLVARSDEERDLLAQIQRRFPANQLGPTASKPASGLVPLTDEEYRAVRAALVEQFEPLRDAYMRGMVVARDDEQRQVLAELQQRIGSRLAP